jgi:hypothetical protein
MSGARSSIVGYGTMPQARRKRVRFPARSLYFPSIYLILLSQYGGGGVQPAYKADNLTTISELTV